MESLDDYLATLNMEGKRPVWKENESKIEGVYRRTRRFLKTGMNVCEIGVGNGYLLKNLLSAGFRTTGVDISACLIQSMASSLSRFGDNLHLIHGNIGTVGLGKGLFDIVFALDVLEHLPDTALASAIGTISDSLRVGGFLVATFPLNEKMAEGMTKCPECGHVFHYVGHHQVFRSVRQFGETLGSSFHITSQFIVYARGLDGLAQRVYRVMVRILSKRASAPTLCVIARRVP